MMRCSNQARFRQQVRFLQRQFLQNGDLLCTDVLSADVVSQALAVAGVAWKDRVYTPLVTLWIFLGQAMSADHSCRAAVARFVAHRVSRGQRACSSHNETDFSSLKVILQMDVMRCKTPELVRKEIWTHVLAYNLIRTITAQSCCRADVLPREISFKATVQTLEAFQPFIAAPSCRSRADRLMLYEKLMDAITVHQVGKRPGRIEPRLRKRRFKKYDYMMKPRNEIKLDILKRLTKQLRAIRWSCRCAEGNDGT